MAGNKFSDDERARIEAAVQAAEKATGLQFLIYMGHSGRDTRARAQKFLVKQGYHEMPGVLIFVAPRHRKVEVVTSDKGRVRVNDGAAARAVAIMTPAFRQGDWVSGLEMGLSTLAEDAGPLPAGQTPDKEMPDIV